MTGSRMRPALLIAGLLLGLLAVTLQGVQGEELENVPSEDQCRPYIEKALKDLGTEGSHEQTSAEVVSDNNEGPGDESAADTNENDDESGSREKRDVSGDQKDADDNEGDDTSDGNENEVDQNQMEMVEITSVEAEDDDQNNESVQVVDDGADSKENYDKSKEGDTEDSQEKQDGDDGDSGEGKPESEEAAVVEEESKENKDEASAQDDSDTNEIDDKNDGPTDNIESDEQKTEETIDDKTEEQEKSAEEEEEQGKSAEEESAGAASVEDGDGGDSKEDAEGESEQQVKSVEEVADDQKDSKEEEDESKSEESKKADESGENDKKSVEEEEAVAEEVASVEQAPGTDESGEDKDGEEGGKNEEGEKEDDEAGKSKEGDEGESKDEGSTEAEGGSRDEDEESENLRPEEEELIMEIEIPEVLRPRDHINQLLKLDEANEDKEKAVEKVADIVLRDLKRLYDNAIKPLETLYKYRDLSNRHFGDPEIFSKPLVLFMGPWSGGKSSIINYLLDIEYKPTSLRTGAEPSPAYFNIVMHGEEEEVLDGTQLAADWTFSGLQKFGQGLLDRLKGFKLKNKLLEKVNIVEIPGILEIRKQVQRLFPFNDACQWFIDRADIIFLVYDPSKLDVGPETEAILDQLKGREYQTRIILNKADQVKPEELMRVQGALIWNISPLMSSAEPPIMYSTSLWSIPYEAGAPTRLLYAQERAFLRDLRSAIDKRVEHKIASARRFAVRVRNHAKMVDCYLTTYYNHKSFFAKKKDISNRIIENPQDYHIYEGLSTLTNISRYDLPDPDVYRDFFRLNTLYEFPLLSSTCTYFRGCPINRLDVAIAYDLPELVGKYKKSVEAALHQDEEVVAAAAASPAPEAQAQKQAQKTTARSGASRISMS